MYSKLQNQLFRELTSHVACMWRVVVYNFQRLVLLRSLEITETQSMPKLRNCSKGKKTTQKLNNMVKLNEKRPRKSVANSVSWWSIWNDFQPPTRESRVSIKQQFYYINRITSLSKETFGFYLTLEERRNMEDLVDHFASASVFAKAHEPCHLCIYLFHTCMSNLFWMLQTKY